MTQMVHIKKVFLKKFFKKERNHVSAIEDLFGVSPSVEFIFQSPIFLPFHTVHGVLKERILKWFAIPFPVEHILSNLSTMTRLSWVAPWARLSFIELDKAMVLV